MGERTLSDLVADARRVALIDGLYVDPESLADAVVPSRPDDLLVLLESTDGRHLVDGIPGNWEAVRCWPVLSVAAHLDTTNVKA